MVEPDKHFARKRVPRVKSGVVSKKEKDILIRDAEGANDVVNREGVYGVTIIEPIP